ncbi:MAG: lipid-A-disaccharide synthase N-terminal domain-containing protein [Candidatus Polarisedimenticolia bacterium]
MTPEGLMHVDAWVLFGLLGQSLFATRFVVQWLASERRGRSVVPTAFWYLSLAGGAILFAYALFHRHDPVFTVGQSAGMIVYVRNLLLIRRSRGGSQGAGAAGA